jgi:hypothetical protein
MIVAGWKGGDWRLQRELWRRDVERLEAREH